jgi:hypothetical protein
VADAQISSARSPLASFVFSDDNKCFKVGYSGIQAVRRA